MNKKVILIVDDEAVNLTVLANLLKSTYSIRACKSGEKAIEALGDESLPDLILLDIMMPGMDGYAVLKKIRENIRTKEIPVIFISVLDSFFNEEKGFDLGAVDYITRPFQSNIVLLRIKAQLELKQARDLLNNQNIWLETEIGKHMKENQLIQEASLIALTQLVETRDQNTGNHILRTQKYVWCLAHNLQQKTKYHTILSNRNMKRIVKAAPLHDIGKIGIPDAILLKPEKLTPEEFDIIKTHSEIGANAIRSAINQALNIESGLTAVEKEASLKYFEEAENIARYHHEKWDGTGYPYGYAQNQIPLSACLMAFADVFDALTSARPYKKPWIFSETVDYMVGQSGKHFAPDVVDAFIEEKDSFEDILQTLSDTC